MFSGAYAQSSDFLDSSAADAKTTQAWLCYSGVEVICLWIVNSWLLTRISVIMFSSSGINPIENYDQVVLHSQMAMNLFLFT